MAIWVVVLVEFNKIPYFGRIWQNSMFWQNLAEFHGLAELGRIWQKQQIAVNYSKLQSCT